MSAGFYPPDAPALLEPLCVVGLLVAVWAINFFILLPLINPGFVTLLPLAASFTSKLLFGSGAALTLWLVERRRPSGEPI